MMKIVLNMIVKNESHIIQRCLDALHGYVDAAVICDTGSTDATVDMLESYTTFPMHVFHDEWKNFGHNRSLAYRHVCETFAESRHEWYVLFLDADMVFHGPALPVFAQWKREELVKCPVWYMIQQSGTLEYLNIRWVHLALEIECVCPTHEFYDIPKGTQTGQTPSEFWIEDCTDGGSKTNKFERDIDLLQRALLDNETTDMSRHPRYWFYLANSFRDSKQYDMAIQCYRQRIHLQGWKEEVYLSWIYVGDCYQKQYYQYRRLPFSNNLVQLDRDKLQKEILFSYTRAVSEDSNRPEALYRLCHWYRGQRDYPVAYLFYQAAETRRPRHTGFLQHPPLFYEKTIFDYLLDVELVVLGYYMGDTENAKTACIRLLSSDHIPETIRSWVTTTSKTFYK